MTAHRSGQDRSTMSAENPDPGAPCNGVLSVPRQTPTSPPEKGPLVRPAGDSFASELRDNFAELHRSQVVTRVTVPLPRKWDTPLGHSPLHPIAGANPSRTCLRHGSPSATGDPVGPLQGKGIIMLAGRQAAHAVCRAWTGHFRRWDIQDDPPRLLTAQTPQGNEFVM